MERLERSFGIGPSWSVWTFDLPQPVGWPLALPSPATQPYPTQPVGWPCPAQPPSCRQLGHVVSLGVWECVCACMHMRTSMLHIWLVAAALNVGLASRVALSHVELSGVVVWASRGRFRWPWIDVF